MAHVSTVQVIHDSQGTVAACTNVYQVKAEDGTVTEEKITEVLRIADAMGTPNAPQLEMLLYMVSGLRYDAFGKRNPRVSLVKGRKYHEQTTLPN